MISRRKNNLLKMSLIGVAAVCMSAGIYLLILLMAPALYIPAQSISWNQPVSETPQPDENRLYIPKLKLNLEFASGNESVLYDGAWHRHPERGNPEKGGNFILAAHRFELGPTPGETRRKSPLYHIDKVEVGDDIQVDFNGKRYDYLVTERLAVKPTQTEIEAPSDVAKLTLYTCTLGGETDGREVLIATPKTSFQ